MGAFDDWAVVVLGCCLIVSISASVVVIVLQGNSALAGTGLGGLTALLAGALAVRVKTTNGKGNQNGSTDRRNP